MISVSLHHQPTSSLSDTSGQWLLTSCHFLQSPDKTYQNYSLKVATKILSKQTLNLTSLNTPIFFWFCNCSVMTINKDWGLFKPSQCCRGMFHLKQAICFECFQDVAFLWCLKNDKCQTGETKQLIRIGTSMGRRPTTTSTPERQNWAVNHSKNWEGQGQDQNHQSSLVEAVSTRKPKKKKGSWTKGIGTGNPSAVAAHLAWPVWPCDARHLQDFLCRPKDVLCQLQQLLISWKKGDGYPMHTGKHSNIYRL